jgi:hypothetical protein
MPAATFTPAYTDTGTQIIAPQALAKANLIRGTLDLLTAPSPFGADLFIGIGRGGVTPLATGAYVRVRKMLKNGGILMPGGATHLSTITSLSAAILKLINNGAGYTANTSTFAIDGTGTPATNETYAFWGYATAPPANGTALPNLEFLKHSLQSGGTSLTVDSPCKIAKIDNEMITNLADTWSIWCPGGFVYEVIVDYGSEANGEALAVVAYAQIYNSEQGN